MYIFPGDQIFTCNSSAELYIIQMHRYTSLVVYLLSKFGVVEIISCCLSFCELKLVLWTISQLWLHVFSKMMVLTEKTLFLDQIDDWLLKKKLDRFFFFFHISIP